MDMEWAKDGETGEMFIVQARPETVQSRREAGALQVLRIKREGPEARHRPRHRRRGRRRPRLPDRERRATSTASSTARSSSPQTTDPDWVPIMKRAAAIVTDHGGRTSHAAIVSRELGLPAIVGTGNATHVLHDEQEVTVSCAEGDEGFVYEGIADFEVEDARPRATSRRPRTQGHAQPRQSGRGVPLVADPGRRRRPGAHGVRRQQPHQRPPDGAGPLRHAQGRGGQARDRRADRRLRRQDRVFRRPAGARPGPHRRRVLPEAGHRAHERLQDQRIRQPDRRRRVRAEGREPDDRLPRRVALLLAALPRGLRARMPGDPAAARGDGLRATSS